MSAVNISTVEVIFVMLAILAAMFVIKLVKGVAKILIIVALGFAALCYLGYI